MECATRNSLILSYLRCQADKAEAERALKTGQETAAERMQAIRREVTERRKKLLDHCDLHGC